MWNCSGRAIHDLIPNEMIERVSIGVDPGGVDVTGIIAAAYLVDGRYAVLSDRSLKAAAAQWAAEVIRLADEYEALDIETDITVEANWGDPTVEDTIRNAALHMAEQGKREDAYVRIQMVTSTKGKQICASPISGLYEQGKILHRPGLAAPARACVLTP